jgi:hypothetical protein
MALLPPISSDKRAIQGRNIDDEEFDLTEEINVDSSGETPERVIGAGTYSGVILLSFLTIVLLKSYVVTVSVPQVVFSASSLRITTGCTNIRVMATAA